MTFYLESSRSSPSSLLSSQSDESDYSPCSSQHKFFLACYGRELIQESFQKAIHGALPIHDTLILRAIIDLGSQETIPQDSLPLIDQIKTIQHALKKVLSSPEEIFSQMDMAEDRPITIDEIVSVYFERKNQLAAEQAALFRSLVPEEENYAIDGFFANVILSTQDEVEHLFMHLIASFIKVTGQIPNVSDLRTVVHHFNSNCAPQPTKAGETLAQIGGQRIYFNTKGHLQIGTAMDRISRSPFHLNDLPTISPEKAAHISTIYSHITQNSTFNTAPPLLEFINFYALCKVKNPTLTLSQAFSSYKPDPIELYDKYKGGNCVIISAKIREELLARGYKNYQISDSGENFATSLPIINLDGEKGIPWNKHLKEAGDISHVETIIPFKTPNESYDALILETSLESTHDTLYLKTPSQAHLEDNLERQHPGSSKDFIETLDAILKKRIAASHKLIICEPGNMDSIFGIDLLSGHIYLSREGAREFEKDLPLSESGKVSIPLEGLVKGEKGDYLINGKNKHIHHAVALEKLIKKIQSRFQLPDDIKGTIMNLASHLPAFFEQLSMSPIPLIKKHLSKIKKLNTDYEEMWSKQKTTPKAPVEFETCQTTLKIIHQALHDDDEPKLLAALEEFERTKTKYNSIT